MLSLASRPSMRPRTLNRRSPGSLKGFSRSERPQASAISIRGTAIAARLTNRRLYGRGDNLRGMLPEKTFEGRVGIITGGATGIGFAMATELSRLGATVVLASRKEENLRAAVEQIGAAGGKASYHVLDVRDAEAVEAMAAKVESDHKRIDFLVNNAAGNFIAPADQLSTNGWNSVIGIVLNGTFYCTSAVGKRMIEKKNGGSILNVIANYAWTGSPGVVHSASAKAGSYLLSDYASYVTGESFVIDGGQWLGGADYWGRIKQMMK